MWDEQSATQVPILEMSLASSEPEEQEVVVKFQPQGNLPAQSSGADVLTKLLTGSSSSSAGSVGTYVLTSVQVASPFRKIEPKPSLDEVNPEANSNSELGRGTGNRTPISGRFLGINATRRGVKICPQCSNKIGYRAKQCKYCCPAKPSRRGRKSRNVGVIQTVCNEESIHTIELGPGSTEVDMVMVQNETEVSTSEETVAEHDAVEVDRQDVFVPTTASREENEEEGELNDGVDREETESNTPTSTPAEAVVTIDNMRKHGSLRDLIRSLLVKQEEQSGGLNSSGGVENEQGQKIDAAAKAVESEEENQPDSSQTEVQEESAETADTVQETGAVVRTVQPSASDQPLCAEVNKYDANSVALFLGHLAQQNGKKLRNAYSSGNEDDLSKSADSALVGVKHESRTTSEPVAAKYRRIQPKFGTEPMKVQVKPELSEVVGEAEKEQLMESRTDIPVKMLLTNPTRRGVMECHKCQRLIGCRSKACKFCKSPLSEAHLGSYKKGNCMRQAVKLQLPVNLLTCLYSVKKSKGGPDHRCFVRCEIEESSTNKGHQTTRYSCDYPLCVTEQELGGKFQNFLCEHAKLCRSQSTVSGARIPLLKDDKLDELPLSKDVKVSLKALHNQCILKEVPLVQLVSDKTLSVVDQLQADQDNALVAEVVSFVHVRFERIKMQGQWQHQAFCSGRSCIAWNPVFSTVSRTDQPFPANIGKANSCSHYSACLWAMASNENLSTNFRRHLMARLDDTHKDLDPN